MSHKNSICLLKVLHLCVSYDAERNMFAVAKFLDHFLGIV